MIVWLSSYPKSGNTWIRSFLSTYLNTSDGIFNLSLLDSIKEFPDHNILNKYMDNKNFHNLGEVSKNWIKVQEFINLKKKHIFLKTHNAFCNINGNLFTNSNNTSAFIYVVRDPRNVITSLSHHYNFNLEEAFDFYTDKTMTLVNKKGKESVVTVLGDWSEHYQSWKKINFAPILIVKYEDLIADTNKSFLLILDFLKKIMSIEILMPALSPTMTVGNLSKWLVKEGDKINAGQVIAEIETDKATMEVEAVDEGKITSILVNEGEENIAVNTPLAILNGSGDFQS